MSNNIILYHISKAAITILHKLSHTTILSFSTLANWLYWMMCMWNMFPLVKLAQTKDRRSSWRFPRSWRIVKWCRSQRCHWVMWSAGLLSGIHVLGQMKAFPDQLLINEPLNYWERMLPQRNTVVFAVDEIDWLWPCLNPEGRKFRSDHMENHPSSRGVWWGGRSCPWHEGRKGSWLKSSTFARASSITSTPSLDWCDCASYCPVCFLHPKVFV